MGAGARAGAHCPPSAAGIRGHGQGRGRAGAAKVSEGQHPVTGARRRNEASRGHNGQSRGPEAAAHRGSRGLRSPPGCPSGAGHRGPRGWRGARTEPEKSGAARRLGRPEPGRLGRRGDGGVGGSGGAAGRRAAVPEGAGRRRGRKSPGKRGRRRGQGGGGGHPTRALRAERALLPRPGRGEQGPPPSFPAPRCLGAGLGGSSSPPNRGPKRPEGTRSAPLAGALGRQPGRGARAGGDGAAGAGRGPRGAGKGGSWGRGTAAGPGRRGLRAPAPLPPGGRAGLGVPRGPDQTMRPGPAPGPRGQSAPAAGLFKKRRSGGGASWGLPPPCKHASERRRRPASRRPLTSRRPPHLGAPRLRLGPAGNPGAPGPGVAAAPATRRGVFRGGIGAPSRVRGIGHVSATFLAGCPWVGVPLGRGVPVLRVTPPGQGLHSETLRSSARP